MNSPIGNHFYCQFFRHSRIENLVSAEKIRAVSSFFCYQRGLRVFGAFQRTAHASSRFCTSFLNCCVVFAAAVALKNFAASFQKRRKSFCEIFFYPSVLRLSNNLLIFAIGVRQCECRAAVFRLLETWKIFHVFPSTLSSHASVVMVVVVCVSLGIVTFPRCPTVAPNTST